MEQTPEAIFRLVGRFDANAALLLRQQITSDESSRAILDFSHVESFDDSTLALLTVNLVLLHRRGHEVALRGLRDHQLRVLHHFGVETEADGSVRLGPPAELPFSD
jgi:anti-anti-sigma regulatory factor